MIDAQLGDGGDHRVQIIEKIKRVTSGSKKHRNKMTSFRTSEQSPFDICPRISDVNSVENSKYSGHNTNHEAMPFEDFGDAVSLRKKSDAAD